MCDSLSQSTGMVLAVLTPDGDVLVASGWQDICTQFHRASENGLVGCIESDTTITRRLAETVSAPEHIEYRCANGLWDVAFPLVVADEHLANVFTGQFFYDDDDVDTAGFQAQARRLGFDEAAYLAALERVPVLPHERVAQTIAFLGDFVKVLADLGLSALRGEQEREALAVSSKRYLSLFENMTEAVALHELVRDEHGRPVDYRLLAVNPAFTGQTGISVGQVSGRLATEVYGTVEAPYLDEFARTTVTGGPVRVEAHFESLDRLFDMTVVRQSDDGFATIFSDITERRRAEDALRESEERFRSFFELTEDLVVISDIESRFLEVNSAWSRTLGYSRAELLGKPYLEFVHPDDLEKTKRVIAEQMKSGKTIVSFENRYVRRDGSVVWLEWSARPQVAEDRSFAIARDVTQRKQAEAALRDSEAALRAVLDATPFPVALVDTEDDTIDYWSSSALALFGHTAPTAAEWYELAYPDPEYRRTVIERWKPPLEEARRSGEPVNTGEYRIACHDGSERICELYATFVADRLVVTFNDITQRKRAEEETRQLNVELEQRVRDRTAQFEAKNEELRSFAYTVSHDLKAPLRGIAGYADELDRRHREGLSERADFCVTQILTATRNMDLLIEDLLRYSRMDAETASLTEVRIHDVSKPS